MVPAMWAALTKVTDIGKYGLGSLRSLLDENDADVIKGAVGELVLSGPTVFAGYWNKPEETAAVLRDGWFHSGDLGRADADGFVTRVDRKKDMIISGGEYVYPIEVEQVLHRHDGVSDVAVIGVPSPSWANPWLPSWFAGPVPRPPPMS
jgi:fatty-acyl-CoA synthase